MSNGATLDVDDVFSQSELAQDREWHGRERFVDFHALDVTDFPYAWYLRQVLQKVEGNVTFHTAMSTAFPQPAPGVGAGPGPMKIPEEQARPMLGMREVRYVLGTTPLAVIDSTLA